jgi:hypothetical protein
MGQYHHPVCIEAEEGLDPAGMDSGLKEGEQGFNRPSTPAAIVALVCARGGNMPADCSQSPLIGRWAGKRVLIQGASRNRSARTEILAPRHMVKSSTAGRVPIPCKSNRGPGTSETAASLST